MIRGIWIKLYTRTIHKTQFILNWKSYDHRSFPSSKTKAIKYLRNKNFSKTIWRIQIKRWWGITNRRINKRNSPFLARTSHWNRVYTTRNVAESMHFKINQMKSWEKQQKLSDIMLDLSLKHLFLIKTLKWRKSFERKNENFYWINQCITRQSIFSMSQYKNFIYFN